MSDACLAGTDNCDSGVHRTPDTCDGGSASDWTCDCSAGWSWVAATNACAADDCEPLPTSGAGFGGECAELVTDMSCTQTCTVGYFVANNGIGVMTCSDGTLDPANQIACQGMYHLRCCEIGGNAHIYRRNRTGRTSFVLRSTNFLSYSQAHGGVMTHTEIGVFTHTAG